MADVIQPEGTFFYPYDAWSAQKAQQMLALAVKKGLTQQSEFGGFDISIGGVPYMRINQTSDGVEGWYEKQASPDLQRLAAQAVYGEV